MRRWVRKPALSFIVVAHNMERELPRTLVSLSKAYQLGGDQVEYEVIVVDNGSISPFGEDRVKAFGDYYRYFCLTSPPPSPAYAMNFGVNQARGGIVCLLVDGARIVTPGLVRFGLAAFRAFEDPTVAVAGWHLGPKLQYLAAAEGYDQTEEDRLLESIGFPADGYRLFEIAVPAAACVGGWFVPMAESNALFLRRKTYLRLGGYDERFNLPGGGLVNLDFYRRAVLREGAELVVLLGEGTFHQIHGGIATNSELQALKTKIQAWRDQYRAIRGEDFAPPKRRPIYLGTVGASVLPSIQVSAAHALNDPHAWD